MGEVVEHPAVWNRECQENEIHLDLINLMHYHGALKRSWNVIYGALLEYLISMLIIKYGKPEAARKIKDAHRKAIVYVASLN